jgi:hypothetical protein
MWGPQVEQQLAVIQIYEFLEPDANFKLTASISDYVATTIKPEQRTEYIKRICGYFAGLLKKVFDVVSLERWYKSSEKPLKMCSANEYKNFTSVAFENFLQENLRQCPAANASVIEECLD